jgi:hypothetical protein
MTMIDTLKFANRLRSAGFSQQQAEAVADAWAEQAREDLPSRLNLAGIEDKITRLDGKLDTRLTHLDGKLDTRLTQLDGKFEAKIAQLDGKVDKLTWMVGFSLAGILAIIARLLLLGLETP